jgi:hypothetical protein
MTMSPFDNQPDPELGRLLREQLTGPAPEAFLRRLKGAVAAERADQWDVLAGWARPRVLAAAIAAGFLLWLGAWFGDMSRTGDPGVTMASSLPAQAVVSAQPPAVDEIMLALREREPR